MIKTQIYRALFCSLMFLALSFSAVSGQSVKVELKKSSGKYELMRAGTAYYVNGAGGEGPLSMLAECGGNSSRIWGVGETTRARLDEAHENGISIAVGVWLEHERHGFDYSDEAAVKRQAETVLEAVKKFKDHPAVLVWGIGNEMEGYANGDNPKIWNHVEDICQQIKKIDPYHPTMSVIAELGPNNKKIKMMHDLCPSLDIIGINAYGGAASLPKRYRDYGGTKPYIVTEFGPIGTWEVSKNSIDAIEEPSTAAKTKMYRSSLESLQKDSELCLGTYAFLWGHKQEGTSTWFGLLLDDGKKLPPVDYLTEAWSGKAPQNLCPVIDTFEIEGSNAVEAGDMVRIKFKASDPEGKKLTTKWTFTQDASQFITGGDKQESPPDLSERIKTQGPDGATIKMPVRGGLYRVYVFVDDGETANVANVPLLVEGEGLKFQGRPAKIPYVIFDEPNNATAFHPSGWMGNREAISVETDCKVNPKVGATCIECKYDKTSGWGGVVWQSPPDDWGDKAGGLNLNGAKKLSFWVRGSRGGEEIKFGFGLIGRDKPFYDTAKKEMTVRLENQWKKVTIDVSNMDLRRIKTGFYWSLASSNQPIQFFLDDIRFE